MILEEVLKDLREVESGNRLMHRPLAGQAADTIELLVERSRILEEKLAAEKARSGRMADYLSRTDTDEDICKKVANAEMLGDCGLEGRDCRECILAFFENQESETAGL